MKTRNHLFCSPVARGTLTDVVVRAWLVHTDTVFAVVLGERREGSVRLMDQLMI